MNEYLCAVAHGKKERYPTSVKSTACPCASVTYIKLNGHQTASNCQLRPTSESHAVLLAHGFKPCGFRPASPQEAEEWPGRRPPRPGHRPHIHCGRGVVEEAGSQESGSSWSSFHHSSKNINHVFEDAAFVLRVPSVSRPRRRGQGGIAEVVVVVQVEAQGSMNHPRRRPPADSEISNSVIAISPVHRAK